MVTIPQVRVEDWGREIEEKVIEMYIILHTVLCIVQQ